MQFQELDTAYSTKVKLTSIDIIFFTLKRGAVLTVCKNLKPTALIYIFCLVIVYIVVRPMIIANFPSDMDIFLIEDIRDVVSFSDYVEKVSKGILTDVQPVRDLSYYLDIQLSKLFGPSVPYISNVLIFSLCITVFINIISKSWFQSFEKKRVLIIAALIFSHPIFLKIYTFIGYRKHLLAFLFILLFFNYFLSFNRNKVSKRLPIYAFIFFLLSLLSQPIFIFTPIFVTYYYYSISNLPLKQAVYKSTPYLLTSLLIGIVNLYWYKYLHLAAPDFANTEHMSGFIDRILAIGRYFSLIFIPHKTSLYYSKASLYCIWGIPLAVVYFFFIYKKYKMNRVIPFILLGILSLLPTTIIMYRTFINESYFLLCAVIILFPLAVIISKYKIFSGIMIVFFLTISFTLSSLYSDNISYLESSYVNNPSCENQFVLVSTLFNRKMYKKGSILGQSMIRKKCLYSNKKNFQRAQVLTSMIIYFSNESIEIKSTLLSRLASKNFRNKFIYGSLFTGSQKNKEVENIIQESIEMNVDFNRSDYFYKRYQEYCRRNPSVSCNKFIE